MQIVRNQLKKISTFIYLLVLLFIVALAFNLLYQWEGVSFIVRVYIFLFSFYLVFAFAELDRTTLGQRYGYEPGAPGEWRLFFQARVVPFMLLYGLVIVFNLIYYLRGTPWPANAIVRILDGRFSNTVIYSLILLLILRLKNPPRITIPLFLMVSVMYFLFDRYIVPDYIVGTPLSFLRIIKYTVVFQLLYVEFYYPVLRLVRASVYSLAVSALLYFSSVGIYFLVGAVSPAGSNGYILSNQYLVKLGYRVSYERLKDMMSRDANPSLAIRMIGYSRLHGYTLDISSEVWGKIFEKSPVSRAVALADYLDDHKIRIDFDVIMGYLNRYPDQDADVLSRNAALIRYISRYYEEYADRFRYYYSRGTREQKAWVLSVIGESRAHSAIPFLIDTLTDIDTAVSSAAYRALVKITGRDFSYELALPLNSPEVVTRYRDFYRDSGTTG